jgi:hypothetical protein
MTLATILPWHSEVPSGVPSLPRNEVKTARLLFLQPFFRLGRMLLCEHAKVLGPLVSSELVRRQVLSIETVSLYVFVRS